MNKMAILLYWFVSLCSPAVLADVGAHFKEHSILGYPAGAPTKIITVQGVGNGVADDTAAVNAAFSAAANGVISFQPGKIYKISNKGINISANFPAVIEGNGATLIASNQVASTITTTINSGGTSATFASAGAFTVGDKIAFESVDKLTYTYTTTILSIAGNNVTFDPVSFASGTQLVNGAAVATTPSLLYLNSSTQQNKSLKIRGLNFDGNAANRTALRHWSTATLLFIGGLDGVTLTGNRFINAPTNGVSLDDALYADVSGNNLFKDIYGIGIVIGGSGIGKDISVTNNKFINVYQFTNATSPTVVQFGHYPQIGAVASSTGPKRLTVSNNHMDVCGAWGFSSVNSTDTEVVLSNNQMKSCVMGAFYNAGGSVLTVSGNIIENSGHEVAYGSFANETTAVSAAVSAQTTIVGNTFIDSVLSVIGDSGQVTIGYNLFTTLNKTNPNFTNANEVGAINLRFSSTGINNCSVSGNVIIGTDNAAGATGALNGIELSGVNNTAIVDNTIYGGWMGIRTSGGVSYTNLTINNNTIVNQANTSGAASNPYGILLGATTFNNLQVKNNTISLTKSGTTAWLAMAVGSTTTWVNSSIKNNQIYTDQTPASGAYAIQMSTNTCSGLDIEGNRIKMNTAGQNAIAAGSAVSACHILANRVTTGTNAFGAATIIYGASDSNFID